MNAIFKLVGTYQGHLLFEDKDLPEFITSPVKEVELKPWMIKRNYHNRIQKKWIKNFGLTKKRCVHIFDDSIFVSPETVKALLHELNDKGILIDD